MPPLRTAQPVWAPKLRGFTLLEMLVSVTILTIIMGVIFTLTQQTAQVYKDTSGKVESFRAARIAFETMTRNLSIATLNNYYDYVDSSGQTRAQAIKAGKATLTSFNPTTYGRASDLHFVSGWNNPNSKTKLYNKQTTHSVFFQAPLGYATDTGLTQLENLLSACGYYIEYKPETNKPTFVSGSPLNRYRLMEFIQPSSDLTVYTSTDSSWFTTPLDPKLSPTPPVHQIAPNIIALLIRPRSSTADADASSGKDPIATAMKNDFIYDSRLNLDPAVHNQLPPIVEVVIAALDEASAARLPNSTAEPAVIKAALTDNNRFQAPADLDTDLADLEKDLATAHLHYRLFRTLVPLRNSKWSSK